MADCLVQFSRRDAGQAGRLAHSIFAADFSLVGPMADVADAFHKRRVVPEIFGFKRQPAFSRQHAETIENYCFDHVLQGIL